MLLQEHLTTDGASWMVLKLGMNHFSLQATLRYHGTNSYEVLMLIFQLAIEHIYPLVFEFKKPKPPPDSVQDAGPDLM